MTWVDVGGRNKCADEASGRTKQVVVQKASASEGVRYNGVGPRGNIFLRLKDKMILQARKNFCTIFSRDAQMSVIDAREIPAHTARSVRMEFVGERISPHKIIRLVPRKALCYL
jgi:hypothetical protein